jgi:fatty acyl-CoA reductase
MCVVASKVGSSNASSDNIAIYNCTSGTANPITWQGIKEKMIEGLKKYPFEKMLWFPSITYQTNPW